VSHTIIFTQIPWASAGAARSQKKREETPGELDITKEEELLAALLNAIDKLSAVFKIYDDLEATADAEQETTVTEHGTMEQRADAMVRPFQPW
jgi:hypothetical protein